MWNKMIIRGARDPAISIIRVLAFFSIITCRTMQYYACELAWFGGLMLVYRYFFVFRVICMVGNQ